MCGLQAHVPSLHLTDACLPLLHDHLGQMSSQAVLGPSFTYTVYTPTPILKAVVIQAILPKVGHADTDASAVVVSRFGKRKWQPEKAC